MYIVVKSSFPKDEFSIWSLIKNSKPEEIEKRKEKNSKNFYFLINGNLIAYTTSPSEYKRSNVGRNWNFFLW